MNGADKVIPKAQTIYPKGIVIKFRPGECEILPLSDYETPQVGKH